MMLKYILSQVFAATAMSFLGTSYFVKDKKRVLILNIFCSIFFALEYFFLDAYAASIINLLNLIRIPWFYFDDKYNKKDYVSLIVISLIVICCGIWTYRIWPDILIIVQGVLFTYSIWQKNVAVYRWIAPFSSGLYVAYNILYVNYLGILFESTLMIVAIIAVVKMYVGKNKKQDLREIKNNEASSIEKSEINENI